MFSRDSCKVQQFESENQKDWYLSVFGGIQALVLCPSFVPKKVDVNEKGVDRN
jgi:hypothetical protein